MQTIEEYIEEKRNYRKEIVLQQYAEELMPRPKGKQRKLHEKEIKEYRKTQKFMDLAEKRLLEDKEYNFLCSEEAKNDPELNTEYEVRRRNDEYREKESILNQSISDFLDYIVEKEDVLIPFANDLVELLYDDITYDLTDGDLYWEETDYYFDDLPPHTRDFYRRHPFGKA